MALSNDTAGLKAMTSPNSPSLLDKESLRCQALTRAALRGAPVARRRLRQRWMLWGLGKVLKWLAVLLALGILGAASWWIWMGPAGPRWPTGF